VVDIYIGMSSGKGQILPFPIDFCHCPYNYHVIVWCVSCVDDTAVFQLFHYRKHYRKTQLF